MKTDKSKIAPHVFRQLKWTDCNPNYIKKIIKLSKAEDLEGIGLVPSSSYLGDITTCSFVDNAPARAQLISRQHLVLCGLELIPLILQCYGEACTFKPLKKDGVFLQENTCIGEIHGPAQVLLSAERVILNFLQLLSGIATETARYVELLKGSKTRLLDTRKTTPGLRVLEKYAVACGGGWNHRMGLFDRVMLKDNHLASCAGGNATEFNKKIQQIRSKHPEIPIEIEVDRLEQIELALSIGADIIMLDNFSLKDTQQAMDMIGDKAYTEASGTITAKSLPKLSQLGLDFISSGAIIHQSQWVDIGLDWQT